MPDPARVIGLALFFFALLLFVRALHRGRM